MVRSLLCLAIIVLQVAVRQEACCRPPEEVANSPVPPLRPPPRRLSSRSVRTGPELSEMMPVGILPAGVLPSKIPPNGLAPAALSPAGLAPLGSAADRATQQGASLPIPPVASARSVRANAQTAITPPPQRAQADAKTGNDSAAEYGAERSTIWNSPEMRAARSAVEEFCRHSARTSPEEGQYFLTRLSQLPAEEMRLWLERFQARRMAVLHGRELEALARQLMAEQAISRLEAMRRAAANIAALRRQAAEASRVQDATAQQLRVAQFMLQKGAAALDAAPRYDPLEPVIDPSSPRGYRRRVGAAMSLPGDLPRSDPRNYIRGEEGIDFGEWATSRDAQPPTRPDAPAPAIPISGAPAAPVDANGDSD